MHFKELELCGFKSFPEKTRLKFEPGITAIVGPNGCGKTNLVDAIKWVLGEQSPRAMRGAKMEDVIFSGTNQRPSLGMAEVSLTLSNSTKLLPIDCEEVTITRRIFRSGESDYFINKAPCRLKDIAELFMGTGIGTNAYSMLEQGQIDLILSSKPEDRRYLFEEVAGITKYKARKREALNKLEQTEANLLRVSDIINEVRRQIGSIERQVKKAQHYREKFERLKELETNAALLEYRKINEQLGLLKEEGRTRAEQESSIKAEVTSRKERIADLHQKLEKLDEELSARQREAAGLIASVDKNQHSIGLNEERVNELRLQREGLLREVGFAKERIQALEEELKQSKERIASLSEEKGRKSRLVDEKEKNLKEIANQIKEYQLSISRAKDEVMPVAASLAESKNELTRIGAELQNAQARRRRLGIEKEKVGKEREELSRKSKEVAEGLNQMKQKVASLQSQRSRIQSEAKELEGSLSRLNDTLQQKRDEFTMKFSEQKLLLELKRSYSGLKDGPKSLLMGRDQGVRELKGVRGAIYELIKARPGYEAAVEAAFGEDLEAIVVDSIASAKDVLNYLKSKELGRAAVLCQDLVRFSKSEAQASPEARGVIGLAVEFLDCTPQFKEVVSYLLKDTLVVKDLPSALEVDLKGYRLVTLDGELMDPKGKLVGGSKIGDDATSLIGRDLKIEKLKDEIGKLESEIAQDERGLKDKEVELLAMRQRGEEFGGLLHKEELKLTAVENELRSLEVSTTRLDEEMGLLDLELDEVGERIGDLGKSKERWEKLLGDAQSKDLQIQNLITSSQEAVLSLRKQREELLVEIAQIRAELSSFEENKVNFDNNLKMLDSSLEGETRLFASRKEQIEANQKREKELLEEMKGLKDQIRDLSDAELKASEEISQLQDRRGALREEISGEETIARENEERLDKARSELHSLEVSQTELSFKASAVKDRIWQAYKVDLGEKGDRLLFDLDRLNDEIAEIKSWMERIGPVNLGVVEEHEELKERLEFLTGQQEDLERARQDFHRAIRKINRTARSLFLETFAKVQVTLKEVFRQLFEGGSAQLILADPSDVLECGIEIVVQPPGKKLQNISLLSGGEKALAAVALLFAIFKVKPSPFCVLDEVDSPLDEANIDRFIRVLQGFLERSQFIIITHNKRTISMADVLYGVTMEESGISKLVSVKLSDREELPIPAEKR